MPTKSNNTGGRGGARPGAGRKKSAVKDKAENGNPSGRKLEVLDIPEVEGVEMPKPHDFLSAEQRDGSTLQAQEIYKETWEWLKGIGCAAKVSPQLLERYAMCSARWVQCEKMTNRMGFLSKHPTTGKPIPSPFINIGINYMNQAVRLWNKIFQIVKGNLIKKALGVDDLPIEITDEKVSFPWFPAVPTPEELKAYEAFICKLCEMARNQKRVNATGKPAGNEKYAFRCFLLRFPPRP